MLNHLNFSEFDEIFRDTPGAPLPFFEIRKAELFDVPRLKIVLQTEVQGEYLYGVPKSLLLETIEYHLTRKPNLNYILTIEGNYAGHLLGGVTLRGMIHHIYVTPQYRKRGLAEQLAKEYLKGLAQEAKVFRTNFHLPSDSYLLDMWPNLGHSLPQGERLVWTDLHNSTILTPNASLPEHYEVRSWNKQDNVFSFWKSGDKDLVYRSVFEWEEEYYDSMQNNSGSTVALYKDEIIGALGCMSSWFIAGIYHFKIREDHRHKGIWGHMISHCLRSLQQQGVCRVHGSGEHSENIFRLCCSRDEPDAWTFVQADLDTQGEAT